jgi:hypothetical protein
LMSEFPIPFSVEEGREDGGRGHKFFVSAVCALA